MTFPCCLCCLSRHYLTLGPRRRLRRSRPSEKRGHGGPQPARWTGSKGFRPRHFRRDQKEAECSGLLTWWLVHFQLQSDTCCEIYGSTIGVHGHVYYTTCDADLLHIFACDKKGWCMNAVLLYSAAWECSSICLSCLQYNACQLKRKDCAACAVLS